MKPHSAWFVLALLSALVSVPVSAQDTSIGRHDGSIFADASLARSGEGVGNIWGGSAGAYLQGRLLGFVLRGSIMPGNPELHIYNAVLGPRVAVDLPFARFFAEAGGGMGHSGYYNSLGAYGSSWGAAWQIDGGIAHHLLPRLDWRIVEVAYGHIYAGPGVSPTTFGTGFTLHLW